jgi:hypothetical protein
MKWLLLLSLLFTGNSFADEFEDEFAEAGSGTAAARTDFEFFGSIELEQGHRLTTSGPLERAGRDTVLANRRFKLKTMKTNDKGGLYAKIDFVRNDVTNHSHVDFRELRLQYKLTDSLDLSAGKQVSTWGVGDMLFINDLFPKNWNANFLGRDMEYMKDSSTSLRLTSYLGPVTWDIIYTPKFAPDTTPTGCQLSTYFPGTPYGTITNEDLVGTPYASYAPNCAGENSASGRVTNADNDGEIATAIKFRALDQDISFYGYRGFYKNPRNMQYDGSAYIPYYARLNVLGMSSEGQIGPGIFTFEYGYYDNKDVDSDPSHLMLEKSMHKYLVGYKIDFTGQLTVGAQVYGEYMTDYDLYKTAFDASSWASGLASKKENSLTYTLRIMYKMQQETLFFNLFTYYRPDDKDSFTNINLTKRLDNNFSVVVGASIFTGDDMYLNREFGMHKDDDLAYVRFKYDL